MDVTKLLTLAGLVGVMLSMGMKVKVADVLASARQPLPVGLGLLANFVLVPAVTLGLLYLFATHPLVSAGFLILAACPGAPVGPLFAALAKGDVAHSIGQMVILGALSAVLSPILLSVLLPPLMPGGDLRIDYLAIVQSLLLAQLLPLAVGLWVNHAAPKVGERIAPLLGLVANLALLAVVVLLLVKEYPTLAQIQMRGWFGMFLLLAVSLGIGWLCGGPGSATRKSLAVTTAARNAAVALVIVSANFAGTPAVTAVIAYSVVSIFGTLGVAFLLGVVPGGEVPISQRK